MSDDFGTVNMRRNERSREIEVMRQQYRTHRDALQQLGADAPTEHLASEYHRLVGEIDNALRKLDELDGRGVATTAPGVADRPFAPPPAAHARADDPTLITDPAPATRPGLSRTALIIAAGLVVLAVIGWLIWRGSERGSATTPVAEQTSTVTPLDTAAPATQTTAIPPPAGSLKVTPALADYGTIRKGTRAVRQFEVTNRGASPISISVGRSTCRCLYYEYKEKVAAKGKETITVTVDGARAKAGTLRETLSVAVKEDPSQTAEMVVQAVIK
jgi:hypothetical protein